MFILQQFIRNNSFKSLWTSQDDFVEKNRNVVPQAIDDICQNVTINRTSDGNSFYSKSATFTLKKGTAELVGKLNETVSARIFIIFL